MSKNFRILLAILISLTLVVVMASMAPRLLSLVYQLQAAQLLEDVLVKSKEKIDFGFPCRSIIEKRAGNDSEIQSAINKLNQAIDLNKSNSQAYLFLGRAYCLKGRPEIAKIHFQDFITLRPNNPLGYIGYAFASELLGENQTAVDYWKKSGLTTQDFIDSGFQSFDEGRLNESNSWFKRALLIDPEIAEAWLGIGKVFEAQHAYDKAIEAYQSAWEASPAISTNDYLRVLKQRGAQRKIIEVLQTTLEEVPQSQDRLSWWRELGAALNAEGNWDQAKQVFEYAISEFPEEPDLHVDQGWVIYKSGGGLEAAKAEFEKAIEVDGDMVDAYYAIARLYTREKRFEEAEQYYRKTISLSPNNRWYAIAQADNLRLAGDLSNAVGKYQDIIEKYPDFSHAYFQVALAYRLSGQKQEAINSIEKAIENSDPPLDTYFARAGDIYRWAGQTQNAILAYRQALEINPNNASVQKSLENLDQN